MKNFCKRGKLELETMIVLIIAILLIIFLIYLVLNNNILSWFGNLPGYEDNKDKLIDELPKDAEIKLNYFKVAVVKEGSKINFCTNGDCGILRDSNLYIKGTEKEGIIYISEKGFFEVDFFNLDDKIGIFKNGKVILDPGFDRGAKEKEGLPLKEDMINLHESIYISGILYKNKRVSLIETGKLDENRDIKFILKNSFKIPIMLRYLRYDKKWQWSFITGEKRFWLFVENKESDKAKELKTKDMTAYNFILSLYGLNNDEGIKLILKEILKKKGKTPSEFSVLVDSDDYSYSNSYNYDSNSPEIGNYGIFIRTIGAEKYEN